MILKFYAYISNAPARIRTRDCVFPGSYEGTVLTDYTTKICALRSHVLELDKLRYSHRNFPPAFGHFSYTDWYNV